MRLNAADTTGKSPFHHMWQPTFTRVRQESQFGLFSDLDLERLADAAIRTTLHRKTPQMAEAAKSTPGTFWFQDHLKHRWGDGADFQIHARQIFSGLELLQAVTRMLYIAREEVGTFEAVNGPLPYADNDFCEQAIDPSK